MMKLMQKTAVQFLRYKFKVLSLVSPRVAAEQAFKLFSTPRRRTRVPLSPVFVSAEKLQDDFNHCTVRGYRWNKGGRRKALIIHGFESSVTNFEAFVQPLIDLGFEVLAFDAPAHGRSGGSRINVLEYSGFIRYIDRKYGPVDSYLAHSLGGLALCLALSETRLQHHPRVALVAPATETTTAIDQFFRFLEISNAQVRNEFNAVVEKVGKQPASWFSVSRTAARIPYPMIWIHDEEDRITPLADALRVREKQPANIRFVITKGLGHSRIYRDPAVRKDIVAFLHHP